MTSFWVRHRKLLLGAGGVIATVGLLLSGGSGGGVWGGRGVGLVVAPVQSAVRGLVGGVAGLVDRYLWLVDAKTEAARLRKENADLRRELARVEEVFQENQRLRSLLEFRDALAQPAVAARVVGRNATPWLRTAVLDKGAADGIRVDAPVVTPEGLVGRVYEVSDRASRVLLLTDPNSAVDALIQRTRAQVVVEGGLGRRCRVLYLPRGEEVEVGDPVVTSGLDGVFPKGILLGRIAAVEQRPGEVFQRAELEPGADFGRLEEVLVLPRPVGEP